MQVAVIGAGFTGLTAALRLAQKGHKVTVFEKSTQVGGLAEGVKFPGYKWTLEKSYHHLFTNDKYAFRLAKEIGQPIIIKRPRTSLYINGECFPLDSPSSILTFPYLTPINRLRMGFTTAFLKVTSHRGMQKKTALPWIRKFMGKKVADLIWEPLFLGKFGLHKEKISLTWFWARIKKRTIRLAYPAGGYQKFAEKLEKKFENAGGKILLNNEVSAISHNASGISIQANKKACQFDRIICTLPTPIFIKITEGLPKSYIKKLSSTPHLSALALILELDKPFLDQIYWLNIADTTFPFLVLAEHTNFMESKYYGKKHILYIGNYLPEDHPYLKMSAKELLKVYAPYLKQINPLYGRFMNRPYLFSQPFAQPVITPDYAPPELTTPLPGIYLANLDSIYPWDRGVNYAIELGEKAAEAATSENATND